MLFKTVMKIVMIPISPYSSGVNKRARTRPTKKVIPCPRKESAKLHPAPLTALFLNESATTSFNYLPLYISS